jgi:gas vesicle protein
MQKIQKNSERKFVALSAFYSERFDELSLAYAASMWVKREEGEGLERAHHDQRFQLIHSFHDQCNSEKALENFKKQMGAIKTKVAKQREKTDTKTRNITAQAKKLFDSFQGNRTKLAQKVTTKGG